MGNASYARYGGNRSSLSFGCLNGGGKKEDKEEKEYNTYHNNADMYLAGDDEFGVEEGDKGGDEGEAAEARGSKGRRVSFHKSNFDLIVGWMLGDGTLSSFFSASDLSKIEKIQR